MPYNDSEKSRAAFRRWYAKHHVEFNKKRKRIRDKKKND